ncbi:class I adenylate-forming enzyme family protein [Streptomyces olivaceoviridis]
MARACSRPHEPGEGDGTGDAGERRPRSPSDGVVTGPPLTELDGLLGGPRLDDLLARAARTAPERPALRSPDGELTYAALDIRVTALAAALRTYAGGPGETIALTNRLDLAFPVAYYAVSRSSNVGVIINPLLPDDRLVHQLRTSRARTAVVTPQLHQRLTALRDRLPELRGLILTHRETGGEEAPTLNELSNAEPPSATQDAAPGTPAAPEAGDRYDGSADHTLACLQFTSGTTGPAKAVRLSHRNLTVNAAQTAHAHRLSGTSVLFNHLPVFHPMHLNIAVTAAATMVLHPGQDSVESLRAAARSGATHYYALPVRLARLAADPRLATVSVPTLRAVLSGGSALSPRAADVLAERLGVPVVQGYGLAEASPSTHLGDLDRPRPGSCGVPAAGTDCRIVDLDTGAALPRGATGEIQVRGPQLMLGYLGRERGEDMGPDGWFATGDIGRVDADGFLFVVDRVKDVFKYDNWLVAPSEIENVLGAHPAVADCAVLDRPDDLHGAVAHAFAAVRGSVTEAELIAYVNARLPYYEHLHGVSFVPEIPRSATGKVPRRELRARLAHRADTA